MGFFTAWRPSAIAPPRIKPTTPDSAALTTQFTTPLATGTAAMVWVGGQIIVHGIEEFGFTTIPHWIHDTAEAASHAVPFAQGAVNWALNAFFSGIVGLILGGAIALGLHAVKKPKAH